MRACNGRCSIGTSGARTPASGQRVSPGSANMWALRAEPWWAAPSLPMPPVIGRGRGMNVTTRGGVWPHKRVVFGGTRACVYLIEARHGSRGAQLACLGRRRWRQLGRGRPVVTTAHCHVAGTTMCVPRHGHIWHYGSGGRGAEGGGAYVAVDDTAATAPRPASRACGVGVTSLVARSCHAPRVRWNSDHAMIPSAQQDGVL